jgi:hypothetical protein
LNERDLYSLESSINSSAPVSLQAHPASADIKHVHGLMPCLITWPMMDEIALRRKRRSRAIRYVAG